MKYIDKPAQQITVPWKRRALDKLDANKEAGISPGNKDQLMNAVGAKKGGINSTLNGPQLTSKYADDITRVLEILPPLVETEDDDDEFVKLAFAARRITRDQRKKLLLIAEGMLKKPTDSR